MDRARIWPAFDAAWVLHEDEDLLVIDKPDGVPTQAADPERPDDVLARLRLARGENAYFGVHQRLDRETSGALLLVKRKEANAAVAAQFEKRAVEKRYVAAVDAWPRGRERAELRDWLAPGDDGRVDVVERRAKGAQEAVTRVRVLDRAGERALLELVLETGRTHQARVQLAHARAPIAGDALYGGPRAPRLLLHARSIGLEHRGARLRVDAPVPGEFEAWLKAGDAGEGIYDDAARIDAASS
jgi:23S rRNA (cytosine1962-C5)-methyltransferase